MHAVHGLSELLQLMRRAQRLQSNVRQLSLLEPELRAQLRHRRLLNVSLLGALHDPAGETQGCTGETTAGPWRVGDLLSGVSALTQRRWRRLRS